jgi:hypothetical protein
VLRVYITLTNGLLFIIKKYITLTNNHYDKCLIKLVQLTPFP